MAVYVFSGTATALYCLPCIKNHPAYMALDKLLEMCRYRCVEGLKFVSKERAEEAKHF